MSTPAHRSLDGSELHAGFVDECTDCNGRSGKHSPDAHHPYVDASMSGVVGAGMVCFCGDPEYTAIHDRPYCSACHVPEPEPAEFGALAPWWHRLWCRLVARFGRQW